jgi:hypothetical protein
MMGDVTTLGEAFIEVHADTRPFARELKRQVDLILKKLHTQVGANGTAIGRTLGRRIGAGLNQQTNTVVTGFRNRVTAGFRNAGTSAAGAFAASFQRLSTSNFILFRVIGNLFQGLGRLVGRIWAVARVVGNVGKAFLKWGQASIGLVIDGLRSLVGLSSDVSKQIGAVNAAAVNLISSLGTLASTAATGAVGILAMLAAVVALSAAMAALAAIVIVAVAPFATLLNFALLIPGALAVVLGIVAPLVIALHGLDDVLKLVFEKDPKKFAEGFAKLSPVMRQLTTSLRTLVPLFTKIQNTVQRNFLRPILTILAPTLRAIGPALTRGLGEAALALGVFVAQAINLLNTPAFTRFISELFPAVAGIVETMGPPTLRLLTALAAMATASLPTIGQLITRLGGFIESFAAWVEGAISDGRFQKFLNDAIASAQSIWNLVTALIALFAEMFTQTDAGGRSFLDKITEAVNKFTAWLRSPDGKRALQDAVVLALAFATAFGIALAIVRTIVSTLSNAIRKAYVILELIGVINRTPVTKTGTSLAHTDLGGYSGGGVVPYDQIAMVHKGEPILDPANSADKNRGILADAGMLDLLSQPNVTNVYVGNEKLVEFVDYRVSTANSSNAKSIIYGSRRS